MVNEGDWVAPVALRVQTPWNIRTHTLLSSFPANLFWMSFCPWVSGMVGGMAEGGIQYIRFESEDPGE